LETNSVGNANRLTLDAFDPAASILQRLAEGIADNDTQRRADLSTWDSATRAMEVLDAVELSLEKGRTIDVFQQQLTQRLAFRGTMAALGCGLLMIGFMAVVFVTILGGAERQGQPPLVPGWPMLLLAVLALFLLLQVVPLLVRQSKPGASPQGRSAERDN
jgi:hypothetical protein